MDKKNSCPFFIQNSSLQLFFYLWFLKFLIFSKFSLKIRDFIFRKVINTHQDKHMTLLTAIVMSWLMNSESHNVKPNVKTIIELKTILAIMSGRVSFRFLEKKNSTIYTNMRVFAISYKLTDITSILPWIVNTKLFWILHKALI